MKPSLLFTLAMLYTILRLEPSALAATKVWTSIGPDGGYVQAIAIAPRNSCTVYIVSGGAIFKSTDGAANWKRVYSPVNGDGVANPAIVVAVNPQDSNTVYAGATDGLFKSTDGGASWTMANAGLPNPPLVPNFVATTGVKFLVIDPRSPETVYAGIAVYPFGGASGPPDLFKSTDGGASWFAASTGLTGNLVDTNGNQTVVNLGVSSVAIDPQDSNTLYAAASGPAGASIFKSIDGGAHWSPSSSGLAVVAVAVDPRNRNTVYAAGDGTFKSIDGGATWSAASSGLPEFILSLTVDPQNPDTLYAGPSGCSYYPLCRYSQLFRSTDGGTSWKGTGLSQSSSPAVLAIDPANSNTLYAGVFNGLVKSMDAGATWNASNSGLIATQIDSLALDPQTPGALFATVHGKVLRTADLGATWSEVSTPLPSVDGRETNHASTLLADPAAAGAFYLAFRGYAESGGILKTTASGASWSRLSLPQGFEGSGVRDLRMDPQDSSTLYASSPNRVLEKSTDGGSSWTEIAGWSESAAGAPVECFEPMALDPRDSNTLYVGGCLSGIFKSTDGGQTWTSFAIPLTSDVGAMAIDPQNSATLYVSDFYAGILKTTDGGKNWKVMSSGLPTKFYIGFIAVDPQYSNILYAAIGGRGVFWSNNGGANWSPLNDGLTTLNVRMMLIDPGNPYTIYAGTSDGGVFAMTLN